MIQSPIMLGNLNANPQCRENYMFLWYLPVFPNHFTTFHPYFVETKCVTQISSPASPHQHPEEDAPTQVSRDLDQESEKQTLHALETPASKTDSTPNCEIPINSKQIKIPTQQLSVKDQTPDPPPKTKAVTDLPLQFRTDWKNDNRNIVPNVINQIISFLIKKGKSHKQIKKIFLSLQHNPKWNEKRFYQYMRRIKDAVPHFVTESLFEKFLQIHEQNYATIALEEQEFYLKVCRIAVRRFLANDAVINALTSLRMDASKRMTHLVAREALEKKFMERCRQAAQ